MQIRRLSSAEADFQKKFSELVAVDASVCLLYTSGPFLHHLHGVGAAFEFCRNRLPIVAKRADGAETGDDNAFSHARPPLTPMT